MSLNSILDSALSGLAAAQAGMRSASVNIANQSTVGYSRERSNQSSAVTAGRTTGVAIGEPQRIADRYLESAVYLRTGGAGHSMAAAAYRDRLQSVFGPPTTDSALSGYAARISAVMTAATGMTGTSAPTEDLVKFAGAVEDAITATRVASHDVTALAGEADGDIAATVARINTLLQQIHALNGDMSAHTARGLSPGGLADQRMNALQELSGLLDVRVLDQPDGRVTVDTATGVTLVDLRLRQIAGAKGMAVTIAATRGQPAIATGEALETPAIGGRLGALLEVRDRVLPDTRRALERIGAGLAEATNRAANAHTGVPAPDTLAGGSSGLVATDMLRFTGAVTFAVVNAGGTLVAKTEVDFDALGAGITVQDGLDAINAGLGGTATAALVDGVLTIRAANAANGVVVAQDAARPSDRAGMGFSHFFGLNDVIRSTSGRTAPLGLSTTDSHGFGPGETVGMELRDAGGRLIGTHVLTGAGGGTVGDLMAELNGSALAATGSFALDAQGHIRFTPGAGSAGSTVSIVTDATDRHDTGIRFGDWSGMGGGALEQSAVTHAIAADPKKLPLAQFDLAATVGTLAVGAADVRGASAFVRSLEAGAATGGGGVTTITAATSRMLGEVGTAASRAASDMDAATARLKTVVDRRDNFSGVDVDEETALLVVLQNSYNASARVVSVTSQMYDTLINMVR